ncbi:hydroxyacylglutathione hydrolase [Spiroplasma chinense]|uniref:Hydroxyacylglutathione hydrolase n=1 Tax=Spiroplasma chinense TaxID=216932 RepID=A0A5B9Y500_9MOLU|nr:MBL fold metallo-hydrolase [Spiroplasma chinense]QEH61863.1 hydroxyacylglutathione hydrolase [Spiroplasma chinense]
MIQVFSDENFKNTNAYLIYNDKLEGILIDTANNKYTDIIKFCKKNGILITDIFITHGHFPHFYGINEICKEFGHPNVYIGKDDLIMMFDSSKNLSSFYNVLDSDWHPLPIRNLKVITKHEERVINGYDIVIIPAPGHTAGSIIIEFSKLKCIFNGDSLFLDHDVIGVAGMTDDEIQVLNSIKFIFDNYTNGYSLFPGHFEHSFTIRELLEKNNIIKKRYYKIINGNEL